MNKLDLIFYNLKEITMKNLHLSKRLAQYVILVISIFSFFPSLGQIITTVAGNGGGGFTGDGVQATTTQLKNPADVAVDAVGNVYIADFSNCRIRKVNTSGVISTIAGNGACGFSGDGGVAAAAQLNGVTGVAVDATGNIYIADAYNHRVRKISSSGTITTIAGNGTPGYSGDGAQATLCNLYYAWSVRVDGSGNVFIADYGNNRIRKISNSGIITTVAGNGTAGFSGDGFAATSAQLNSPQGLALDAAGNIFVSDKLNHRIRKINSSGIISTYGGSGNQGYYGNGIPAVNANLNTPLGISTDGMGNVYIADYLNNIIRMINTSGIITDAVASGVPGYFGDGGTALSAQIFQPWGVFSDPTGNIWVADTYNHRVRSVNSVLGINQIGVKESLLLYPNPTVDVVNLELNSYSKIVITDLLGEEVIIIFGSEGKSRIDIKNIPNGIYFLKTISLETGNIAIGKIIKQ